MKLNIEKGAKKQARAALRWLRKHVRILTVIGSASVVALSLAKDYATERVRDAESSAFVSRAIVDFNHRLDDISDEVVSSRENILLQLYRAEARSLSLSRAQLDYFAAADFDSFMARRTESNFKAILSLSSAEPRIRKDFGRRIDNFTGKLVSNASKRASAKDMDYSKDDLSLEMDSVSLLAEMETEAATIELGWERLGVGINWSMIVVLLFVLLLNAAFQLVEWEKDDSTPPRNVGTDSSASLEIW